MRGIRAALDADVHHGVVARMLAFVTEASTRHPEQWIEPIDASHDFRGNLYQPIPTRDMRELVGEHHADAILGRAPPCCDPGTSRLRRTGAVPSATRVPT